MTQIFHSRPDPGPRPLPQSTPQHSVDCHQNPGQNPGTIGRQITVGYHQIPREQPPEREQSVSSDRHLIAPEGNSNHWGDFARYKSDAPTVAYCPGAKEDLGPRGPLGEIQQQIPSSATANHDEENHGGYMPLSRTTDRVLRILLDDDLSRVRAESVADTLGISCTTLRRRLRNDHTSYQFLLDRARQFRCESRLRERWLPGKCLADELGYLEVNSFYRAFRRWTGVSYSDYRQRYH
ncbi:AraC family transcriptional regulator [Congregibacter brevis]|uniref:AraC family transcriptional regulator n=1 Tax=Congregibacter brevis TaxID=3081201 RepID=A0ABZ0IES6_9GAMM|nr:AraC family transcriptional regulator [Congregibacter sp. IMCC45268]